jgi:hypothetical protein
LSGAFSIEEIGRHFDVHYLTASRAVKNNEEGRGKENVPCKTISQSLYTAVSQPEYSYPQYCFLYNEWLKKQKRSMRQTHAIL